VKLIENEVSEHSVLRVWSPELPFTPWTHGCWCCYNLKYRHRHGLHNFYKQPKQPDFHFKISGLP